jgi:hypothetical protein
MRMGRRNCMVVFGVGICFCCVKLAWILDEERKSRKGNGRDSQEGL